MKKENGITLVALVITIIILLVLAGITIETLIGNGLFEKAKNASNKYKTSEIKEKIELFKYTNQIENSNKELKDFFIEEGLVTKEELNEKSIITLSDNIILLNNYEGLKKISNNVQNGEDYDNKIIYLLNDIDAGASFDSETGELISGDNFFPIGYSNCRIEDEKIEGSKVIDFNGTFDGNNHKISNLYIKKNEETDFCTALFGYVGEKGIIKDLTISDSYIWGYYEIGAFAGRNRGHIINCVNEGKVVGDYHLTGGIVGRNIGTIENCVNKGYIKGNVKQTGGIVGNCDFGNVIVKNCVNYGRIDATGETIGGIVGGAYTNEEGNSLVIKNCSNYAIVGNYETNSSCTGGIIGAIRNQNGVAEVSDCINYGEIRGYSRVGGITGVNAYTDIRNCINKGCINLEYDLAGGITGYNNAGILSKCINYGKVSLPETGRYGTGGIAGRSSNTSTVSKIELCCNFGEISNLSSIGQAGGIAGNADSGSTQKNIIINCYNSGNINASKNVGGIVACASGLTMENCYNVGTLMATDILGGLVGYCVGTTNNAYQNNYWLDSCGATTGIYNNSVEGIESKKSEELKKMFSILGSEFSVDSNNINKGYPILNWQK